MERIQEIKKKRKEEEKARERELQDTFDADAKDVIAFSIAVWQLLIPLVVALFIVGMLIIFIFNLF